MRQESLYFDDKGMIVPDDMSEEEYISEAKLVLEASEKFELNDEISGMIRSATGIEPKKAFRMLKSVADEVKQVFRTDLSWVVTITGGSSDPLKMGISKWMGCTYEGRHVHVPVILFLHGMGVLFHESVHILRTFYKEKDNAFEEAFAFYNVSEPRHGNFDDGVLSDRKLVITAARKTLEGVLGDNASYALARLSRDEVYGIINAPNALGYLKGLDCLRHRIVKERLGI